MAETNRVQMAKDIVWSGIRKLNQQSLYPTDSDAEKAILRFCEQGTLDEFLTSSHYGLAEEHEKDSIENELFLALYRLADYIHLKHSQVQEVG